MYYVYELINPNSNLPFYVGQGAITRPSDHIREAFTTTKNSHKLNTIRSITRQGLEVKIKYVFESDKVEDVKQEEIRLIAHYGRRDLGTGILTNETDGGDGRTNHIKSPEECAAIKARTQGCGNPMYGRNHTEESKEKLSQTRKKLFASGQLVPTTHSEEHKAKLKEYNPGAIATSKPVARVCPDTGEVLEIHQSGNGLGFHIDLSKPWNLYNGFYWRRLEDTPINNLEELEQQREKMQSSVRNARKVGKFLNDRLIQTFSSLKEAHKEVDMKYATFWSKVNAGKEIDGFLFRRV